MLFKWNRAYYLVFCTSGIYIYYVNVYIVLVGSGQSGPEWSLKICKYMYVYGDNMFVL